jgi:hypothetical protein
LFLGVVAAPKLRAARARGVLALEGVPRDASGERSEISASTAAEVLLSAIGAGKTEDGRLSRRLWRGAPAVLASARLRSRLPATRGMRNRRRRSASLHGESKSLGLLVVLVSNVLGLDVTAACAS